MGIILLIYSPITGTLKDFQQLISLIQMNYQMRTLNQKSKAADLNSLVLSLFDFSVRSPRGFKPLLLQRIAISVSIYVMCDFSHF